MKELNEKLFRSAILIIIIISIFIAYNNEHYADLNSIGTAISPNSINYTQDVPPSCPPPVPCVCPICPVNNMPINPIKQMINRIQ
jgi:hypothetical protein